MRRKCDYSWMFTIACCRVRISFSVRLVSCYAHVFVLLSAVIVTLPNRVIKYSLVCHPRSAKQWELPPPQCPTIVAWSPEFDLTATLGLPECMGPCFQTSSVGPIARTLFRWSKQRGSTEVPQWGSPLGGGWDEAPQKPTAFRRNDRWDLCTYRVAQNSKPLSRIYHH